MRKWLPTEQSDIVTQTRCNTAPYKENPMNNSLAVSKTPYMSPNSVRGTPNMKAEIKVHCTEVEHLTGSNTPPSREQEIKAICSSEYRRLRFGDHDVYLRSSSRIAKMGEGGHAALTVSPQYELKKDVASAMARFSPTERRIIFRVYIQGQSIDLATKGSRFSASYWKHRLNTVLLPHLKKSLQDYVENERVVL